MGSKSNSEVTMQLEIESFERMVKEEFGVDDSKLKLGESECYRYQDKQVDLLWFVFNNGYYTRQGHILTYGCPDLTRLYDLNHPNTESEYS